MPDLMSILAGKVAVVTGSWRGIGATIAKLFAQSGAAVAVHGRDEAAISAVHADIERHGGRALSVVADVTVFDQIEVLRRRVEERLGPTTKMRFLSMIRLDETRGQVPSEQLMRDMGKLMDEMAREGSLVRTAGLRPTSEGARVRLRQGKLSAVDGPFTETKEVIGGFAILEAKSMSEAIELTKRFLCIHGTEWDIECEVRRIDGPEFGADA
jgi:hypothetical protein